MTGVGLVAFMHQHEVTILGRLDADGQLSNRQVNSLCLSIWPKGTRPAARQHALNAEVFALHQQHMVSAVHVAQVVGDAGETAEFCSRRHQKIPGRLCAFMTRLHAIWRIQMSALAVAVAVAGVHCTEVSGMR